MKFWWMPLTLALVVAGCNSTPEPEKTPAADNPVETPKDPADPAAPAVTEKVKTTDVKVGTGATAETGDMVYMTYTGKLKSNGTEFDSNNKPGADPFAFVLGAGQVIKGWDQGIVGMKVGGKRLLEIPASLAYGAQAQGAIPANSDLNFDVEVLHVLKSADSNVVIKQDIKPGSGPAVKAGERVMIHYDGYLVNGKKFDSSRDRNQTFEFTVGSGEVVPGMDAGVTGMKKGGQRRILIPPALGYGQQGKEPIGANMILIFEMELVNVGTVQPPATP